MDIRLGFIGVGNMGSALVKGIIKSGLLKPDSIYVYDTNSNRAETLSSEVGINVSSSGMEVIEDSDIIILAVKPNMVKAVLEACKDSFHEGKTLISIAAGIPINTFKKVLGDKCKIVRTMPNTPALVGEGMTIIAFDDLINGSDKITIEEIFRTVGKVQIMDEALMSEVIALTSSSPAYVYMLIEAMADSAVLSGIPRNLAYELGAQAVLGSAKMVLETGKHPGELKDMVCSPAGTTIEAVTALEQNGFRNSIIQAMNQCTKRARELGNNK